MSQSTFAVCVLLIAFLIFITARGELVDYIRLLV
jgi:hypothetical protein